MNTTISQKLEYLNRNVGEDFSIPHDPDCINHYYKSLHDYGMGVCDADDYAWLNTLFGYDIGAERALGIIRWYYENLDATVMDMVTVASKETLQNICELELGLHLDFSCWPEEEPKVLRFGFDEKGE